MKIIRVDMGSEKITIKEMTPAFTGMGGKRKFKIKLDYLTSPGYLDGPHGRQNAGLPEGGHYRVITDMGIMGFDDKSKEMFLTGYYPGIAPEKILENMEFDIDISQAKKVDAPTLEELKLLREKCDPQGLIL